MRKLVLTSNNIQLPNNPCPVPATIIINCDSGKIVSVYPGKGDIMDFDDDVPFCDFGDLYVLPGLVDAHVHLNEPGRTNWEGFYTGTRAAVAGGFTTVVDMPLNSIPPTTTVCNLELKRRAAEGQCWCDTAFWGGVIPNNQNDLLSLVQAGVKGFKCFLIESGVEEFPHVSENDVKGAMDILDGTSSVLLFHAELDSNPKSPSSDSDRNPTLYSTFLETRPDSLEVSAINLIINLAKHHPILRTHIVHLSSAAALPLIRTAKSAGLKLTVETCFHYLCLTSVNIPSGHPEFKCCPPIRGEDNQAQLWDALMDGTIDLVVSDHSPCVAELKCLDTGDIMQAWGGINGLGLGLSLLWTEGRKRGIDIACIVEWLSTRPATHAGLGGSKGSIEVGKDADIVIFDPESEFMVTKETLHFKNKLSPYEGMILAGEVKKTFLRGHLVWDSARQRRDVVNTEHVDNTRACEDAVMKVRAQSHLGKQPVGMLL